MGFSYKKSVTLKPQKEKWLSTFLISLLVSATFFVPYMIMSRGYFTFYGDFNVQQIVFYQNCHEAIRSGNIFWSWTTDLGASFIPSYTFYLLGSPFFWLTLPFPTDFVPYLMGPLLILKFGCAALTSYFYIRRFTRTADAARLGAILYAFSGFSIYNVFFNHFHEAIIVFPLLLLAVELLITENRRFVFALMVAVCAVTNYFFFFGMVVFTVIYFIVRVCCKAVKVPFSRFAVMVFEAVLGLLLSAFILLPAILSITGNSRISEISLGWNAIFYGKEQIYGNVLQCFFFPPDIPARPVFFPGADVKWASLGGWLPLFSMVGVFTWFSQRKKSWLKRLIGIMIFMALVPFLNCSFYAFNSAYYARWYYMPILMMCLATVSLTEDETVDWSYGYKWVLGITLAVTAVVGFFPQYNSEGKIIFGLYSKGSSESDLVMYSSRFFISCGIAILSLVILGLILKLIKKNRKAFYTNALVFTCIICVIYGNVYVACGRAHSFSQTVVIDEMIEGEINLEDESAFRVDCYDCVDNTSMYLGLSGINAFHSVVPTSIMEFYEYIGYDRNVASRPDEELYAIRPLLSVKYLLNRVGGDSFYDEELEENVMVGYTYLKTECGYDIYTNDYYVPYGFSYNYYMSQEFCDNYQASYRPNLMLKAILLSDEQIEKYSHLFEGSLQDLADQNKHYQTGDYTSLSLSDTAYKYDSEQLAKTSAESFVIDNRGFTATVYREKESLVFFSVPYEEGWSAAVNGKAAEIEKVNAGFMAVLVPAGYSTIRFDFMTYGLVEGIEITLIAAVVFLLYIIIFLIWNKKHKAKVIYPEGEELLKTWRAEELADARREAELLQAEEKPSILDFDFGTDIPSSTHGFEGGFIINTEQDKEEE